MTLTITLDEETERGIERKASRLGISPAEYLLRLAERDLRPKVRRSSGGARKPEMSAADALSDHIGVVQGTPGPYSGASWSEIEAAGDDH